MNLPRFNACALFCVLCFSASCIYKHTTQIAAIPNLPQDVRLDLPRALLHSETDEVLRGESAMIVSITSDRRFYLGGELTPKDQLSYKLGELLKRYGNLEEGVRQPDPDKTVYLAGSVDVEYGVVINTLDLIRRQEVTNIGLIALRKPNSNDSSPDAAERSRFLVVIPAVPDPNLDLRLKPNLLTLVVSLSPGLRFSLNNQEGPQTGEPCAGLAQKYGSVSDPQGLAKCLEFVFQRRKEARAYRPGFETRADVPEDDRVEKTIFIKAPRSIKYGDVIRAIDAVKGAGANPINLQIDDLPH